MKREGGIMVVSLSRDDGQGRRGVTQDGSKWVFRPAGNDSPENWPDPRICVAHICGDTETRERVQCVITSRVSVRLAGISDDSLFHKSEIRDELDMIMRPLDQLRRARCDDVNLPRTYYYKSVPLRFLSERMKYTVFHFDRFAVGILLWLLRDCCWLVSLNGKTQKKVWDAWYTRKLRKICEITKGWHNKPTPTSGLVVVR